MIVLVTAAVARADPVATCTSQEAVKDCSSWFGADVTVSWSDADTAVSECDQVVAAPPAGISVTPAASCPPGDEPTSVPGPLIHFDREAPSAAPPPPNANGWYTAPLTTAVGSDGLGSGVASCTSAYSGPDSGSASVPWTCTDLVGNVGTGTFTVPYDATPPFVSVTPARPPDANGWYVRPVSFAVSGSDGSGSGVGSCSPVTYAGPDSAGASISSSCADLAGNVGTGTFSFMYDATPPALGGLTAVAGDGTVAVVWHTDGASVEVLRVPGIDEPASIVFGGTGDSFIDTHVSNGTAYTYLVTVRDPAGNASTQSIRAVPAGPDAPPAAGDSPVTVLATIPPAVVPKARRIRPAPGSVLAAGHAALFRWPASKRARYYNLQLYRSGRKILSGWPSRPRYHLTARWNYGGAQRRLRPGRYRWMVWPGLGARVRATYGKRIVNSTFVVRRLPPPTGTR